MSEPQLEYDSICKRIESIRNKMMWIQKEIDRLSQLDDQLTDELDKFVGLRDECARQIALKAKKEGYLKVST